MQGRVKQIKMGFSYNLFAMEARYQTGKRGGDVAGDLTPKVEAFGVKGFRGRGLRARGSRRVYH